MSFSFGQASLYISGFDPPSIFPIARSSTRHAGVKSVRNEDAVNVIVSLGKGLLFDPAHQSTQILQPRVLVFSRGNATLHLAVSVGR